MTRCRNNHWLRDLYITLHNDFERSENIYKASLLNFIPVFNQLSIFECRVFLNCVKRGLMLMCDLTQGEGLYLCSRFRRPGPVGASYGGSVKRSSHPQDPSPPLFLLKSACSVFNTPNIVSASPVFCIHIKKYNILLKCYIILTFFIFIYMLCFFLSRKYCKTL